jgi:phenylacetate-CoA ligase
MFVHAGQVAEITRRFPELGRARLVVTGEMANDRMSMQIEAASVPEGLAERVAAAVRDVTKLRGEVTFVAPGSLPNDGRVIEDARTYV